MIGHGRLVLAGGLAIVIAGLLSMQCKGSDVSYDPKGSLQERQKAVSALRASGERSSLAPLLRGAQEDDDEGIRETAVVALGHLGAPEAIDVLAGVARHDEGFHVRRRAAEALGRIRDARAAEQLATLWSPPTTTAHRAFNLEVRQALIGLGALAVPALRTSLGHESEHIRWKAVEALAEIGDPAAIDDLRALLDDPSPTVQGAARDAIEALDAKTGR